MDVGPYLVRPFTDSDFDTYARIWTRLEPDNPVSADRFRHWYRVDGAHGRFQHYVVSEHRVSREVVAVAAMWQQPGNFDPDNYWTRISVDPAHQCRGVGRQLFREIEGVALSRRAKLLWSFVRADDPRGVRFFERTGFVERRRVWNSRLDLTQLSSERRTPRRQQLVAEGVEFTTLAQEGADRPEVRERLYRLYVEAQTDVPRMGPTTSLTFEQFLESVLGVPGLLRDGLFLARVGEEYVAMTSLASVPSKPDTLHIEFTGALRSFRGRGVTSELKRRSAEFARARGYRFLETNNDSLNEPIWAINEKLGFRQFSISIFGEKTLLHSG